MPDMDFAEWCDELNRLSKEVGWMGDLIEQTGEDCWREYYEDGVSPKDALNEEISYGGEG